MTYLGRRRRDYQRLIDSCSPGDRLSVRLRSEVVEFHVSCVAPGCIQTIGGRDGSGYPIDRDLKLIRGGNACGAMQIIYLSSNRGTCTRGMRIYIDARGKAEKIASITVCGHAP